MTATIKAVSPKPRVWDGPKGTLHFINVFFEDGSAGDYGAKPETSQQHLEALQALIGTPGEFELEPAGEYQGTPKVKIKGYPGQTIGKGGGFGGGKNYVPSYTQTEAGFLAEQRMMNRRTALMQSVQYGGDTFPEPETVIECAERFFAWLQAGQQPNGASHSTPPVVQRAVQGSAEGKWAGPGRSPCCDCVPNSVHKPSCQGVTE